MDLKIINRLKKATKIYCLEQYYFWENRDGNASDTFNNKTTVPNLFCRYASWVNTNKHESKQLRKIMKNSRTYLDGIRNENIQKIKSRSYRNKKNNFKLIWTRKRNG